MKTDLSIAKKYSVAFFELAKEKSILDKVASDLKTLEKVLESDPQIKSFTFTFKVTPEEKSKVFASVFPDFNELTQNLLATIFSNKRQMLIFDIIKDFSRLYKTEKNELDVKIFVPAEIETKTEETISTSVGNLTGKKVVLEVKVQPALLGGAKLRIGNTIYDGTVSGRLNKLRQELLIG
ncbi:ATP synthase F1 subunit delta [bacterium]|nr:ATP synthase F1 subunit delta [bacterium]